MINRCEEFTQISQVRSRCIQTGTESGESTSTLLRGTKLYVGPFTCLSLSLVTCVSNDERKKTGSSPLSSTPALSGDMCQ